METLIWRFLLHLALWWRESKLWKPFYFVFIEAGICSIQYMPKKRLLYTRWSCSSISMIGTHLYFLGEMLPPWVCLATVWPSSPEGTRDVMVRCFRMSVHVELRLNQKTVGPFEKRILIWKKTLIFHSQ